MMKKVVIIDSGINRYIGIKEEKIVQCIKIICSDNTVEFQSVGIEDIPDNIYHGTSVYSVIQNYSTDDEFIIIKAYNDELEISSNLMVEILLYIYNNIECDIINMSCGCILLEDKVRMQNICESIRRKGIVIVAAFSNEGILSYPAAFDAVIGVDYSLSCFSPKDYYFIENSSINIRGIGHTQNLPVCMDQRKKQIGSSFVTPHITGMLLQCDQLNFDNALTLLRENAKQIISFQKNEINRLTFEINKAVIFPYSKETDVMLRNRDMLNFKLEGVLCTKHQYKTTWQNMNNNNIIDFPLYTMDNYMWEDTSVDTIIIAHVNLLSKALRMNVKKNLLQKALQYHKNVYMFDDIDNDEDLIEEIRLNENYVFTPTIQSYQNNDYGKLNAISSPVLGIFGTGPKQGKFSLQLRLKKYLSSIGYQVSNFGTEPTAPLFGFESCFPYGYNNAVHIDGDDAISFINVEIARLDKVNTDIILVGSQSQTIPTGNGNIGFYNYKQYELILGSQPDAYFLCVYINDDIEFIKRTIHFLESINDAKVLGIVIFPYVYNNINGNLTDNRQKENESNINIKLNLIKEKTSKSVFSFMDSLLEEKLLNKIQEYFS